MKTIEEKAIAYDEAIERAKELLYVSDKNSLQCKTIERIFPELKESEDERIRENIITYFKAQQARLSTTSDTFTPYPSWIAWLEKQSEHSKFRDSIQVGDKITKNQDGVFVNLSQLKRTANKVEPKFKIGDWIIDSRGDTLHIISVEYDYYVVEDPYAKAFDFDRASADLSCHLWSIQYAEPGDILVAENGWTCIFRKLEQKTFHSYCFMDSAHNFYSRGSEHTLDDRICGKMYPATKEQRDLFFSKMKEAGYEWDSKHFKLTK